MNELYAATAGTRISQRTISIARVPADPANIPLLIVIQQIGLITIITIVIIIITPWTRRRSHRRCWIALWRHLKGGGWRCGLCLQSDLHRAARDCRWNFLMRSLGFGWWFYLGPVTMEEIPSNSLKIMKVPKIMLRNENNWKIVFK